MVVSILVLTAVIHTKVVGVVQIVAMTVVN